MTVPPRGRDPALVDGRTATTHPPEGGRSVGDVLASSRDTAARRPAVAPIQEAVDIYRALADSAPDTYLPDLAASLNNLSNQLAGVGRRADAVAPIQEAVDIRRALADSAPDTYLPDLAMSAYNLTLSQTQENRLQDALPDAREAVSTYRVLADTQADLFLEDLRDALRLALGILDELDRSEERESVRRELEDVEQRLRD